MNVFDITDEWQFKAYGDGVIFLIHTPTNRVANLWAIGTYNKKQKRAIEKNKNLVQSTEGYGLKYIIEDLRHAGFVLEEI
jgi:hypothetical protein